MVQYLESTRNYFYKQYKNGKKKRISFESYNRVMKGGFLKYFISMIIVIIKLF